MIYCAKCNNETRLSELLTSAGPVMISGPANSAPQPLIAQACTACGYVELYAPQPLMDSTTVAIQEEAIAPALQPAAVAAS
jgi:predicted nucleic-acid-binding Zn-ribbon protein